MRSNIYSAPASSVRAVCSATVTNVNPNADRSGRYVRLLGRHGRYDGGQAEYVRVPFADVGPS